MADIFTKDKRTKIMALVKGKETKPELIVRRYLFSKGFRYRKNVKTLLGKPDVVLRKYMTVIFVNGCFWHGHSCKKGALPSDNREFWKNKILSNIKRDERNINFLEDMGWKVIVLWQCQIKNKKNMIESMKEVVNKILWNCEKKNSL